MNAPRTPRLGRFLTPRFAKLLVALGAVLSVPGCSDDDDPSGSGIPPRRYTVAVLEDSIGNPPVVGANVEANTSAEIYSVATDASGVSIVTVPGNVPLPDSTVLTIDHVTILPHAIVVDGEAGAEVSASPLCTPAQGRVMTKIPRLHRLGDGIADPGSGVSFQIPVEEAEIEIQFNLTAGQIPDEMPSYRIQARGIQAPVNVLLNGISVAQLAAAPDDRLRLYAGVLTGVPSSAFLLGPNSLRLEASVVPSAPTNVDDFEICALVVYRQ
ncbi:MAG: hypothetical protein ACREOU_11505 [Candidatus Eiseniibacteriota bacterium]